MTHIQTNTAELVLPTIEQVAAMFTEIHSYFKARKEHPVLNCERVISLLRVCCSFLLDPRSRAPVFTDRVGANWYQFTMNGRDSEGNKIQISFCDGFRSLINDMFSDLAKGLDAFHLDTLLKLLNAFIKHPRMDVNHKFVIMNAENSLLKVVYDTYLWTLPGPIVDQYINTRKNYILQFITSVSNTQQESLEDIEMATVYAAYEYYLRLSIKNNIRSNRYSDIMDLLDCELNGCNDRTPAIPGAPADSQVN